MNILLAIDPSVHSEAAVSEVLARPWPAGSKVGVLSVVDSTMLIEALILIEASREDAEALVKNAAERISSRGIEVSTAVVVGRPKVEIVEYAKGWGADLIVVGSHGRRGLTRFLLGSVAQAVIRHAHCSVEVIRAASAQNRRTTEAVRILLATDGSDASMVAARSIADRPWPRYSQIMIVSVVDLMDPMFERTFRPGIISPELIQSAREDATRSAREIVSSAKKALAAVELELSTTVALGSAKDVILDTAREFGADLIVVGSHGRHGINRLLMGSVSEAVAIHAHCSVSVVRERDETD